MVYECSLLWKKTIYLNILLVWSQRVLSLNLVLKLATYVTLVKLHTLWVLVFSSVKRG